MGTGWSQAVAKNEPLELLRIYEETEVGKRREMVESIIEANDTDAAEFNALHWAAMRGHTETVRLLITDCAADVEAVSSRGETPLMLACGHGHVATALLLLDLGKANIFATDAFGWTPLHHATASGNLELVQDLITRGASAYNVTTADRPIASIEVPAHSTCSDIAAALSHDHLAALLGPSAAQQESATVELKDAVARITTLESELRQVYSMLSEQRAQITRQDTELQELRAQIATMNALLVRESAVMDM